ncbi:TetR family transcriptional regulator C-terminal domain-containing protein [Pseudoneobacillus sp. C159]
MIDSNLPKIIDEHNVDFLFEDSYKDVNWGLLSIEFLLYNVRNEQMQKRNETKYENWQKFIEEIIRWGQNNNQLSKEIDISKTVSAVFALYDGFFIHSALYPDKIKKEDVTSGLLKLLGL